MRVSSKMSRQQKPQRRFLSPKKPPLIRLPHKVSQGSNRHLPQLAGDNASTHSAYTGFIMLVLRQSTTCGLGQTKS